MATKLMSTKNNDTIFYYINVNDFVNYSILFGKQNPWDWVLNSLILELRPSNLNWLSTCLTSYYYHIFFPYLLLGFLFCLWTVISKKTDLFLSSEIILVREPRMEKTKYRKRLTDMKTDLMIYNCQYP